MANRHAKCEICRLRHRPGNCRPEGGGEGVGPAQGNPLQSLLGIVATLDRICGDLTALVEKLPCVAAAKSEPNRERPPLREDHLTCPRRRTRGGVAVGSPG